jgi:hypothetical protein
MIKADDMDCGRNIASRAKERQHVGSSSEANVPDNEFSNAMLKPFAKVKLPDVQRFRFGGWSHYRMERFTVSERTDAVNAIGEFNEFVARHLEL